MYHFNLATFMFICLFSVVYYVICNVNIYVQCYMYILAVVKDQSYIAVLYHYVCIS